MGVLDNHSISNFAIDGVSSSIIVNSGDNVLMGSPLSYTNTVSTSSSTFVKKCGVTVKMSGTCKVSFNLYGSLSDTISYGQIYVNGSPVGTLRSVTGTSGATFTEDISIKSGDEIQLYMKAAVEGSAICSYFVLKTNEIIADFKKY